MLGGILNQPKILRGAFVEYDGGQAALAVVFQFNPMTISRARTTTVKTSDTPEGARALQNQQLLNDSQGSGARDLRRGQSITINSETLSFDIRLDATEKINEGDESALKYGVMPQLSTLEQLMLPKEQRDTTRSSPGQSAQSYAFADEAKNPPVTLFVWGRKKVLPVNITNMQIREEEFNSELSPTRAVISVSLQVIEGPNAAFLQQESRNKVLSLVNDSGDNAAKVSFPKEVNF